MASRTYDKLPIEEFGTQLITSGDLDPIYLALHKMSLPVAQRNRWLLVYWCFYHAGLACYLSEFQGNTFWKHFKVAAENKRDVPSPTGAGEVNGGWPRGKERRHFRGQQAIVAAGELQSKFFYPESAIDFLVRPGDAAVLPFATVRERVQEWRGFGNWIAYKVGDMLDRCSVHPVEFSYDDAMYDSPRKCALSVWKYKHGVPQVSVIDDEPAAIREVVDDLLRTFSGHDAPPLDDRSVGLTEIETILCKWGSHMTGSYPLLNDIDEINHGIAAWAPLCHTAQEFAKVAPKRK